MKIVLLESLGISESSLQRHIAPLTEAGHEFKAYPKNTDPAVQIEEAKDADIIMIANMPLRAEVINSCSKLKYIDVAFTGVDHVDLEAARAKGIQVSNAAGYSTQSVAELVLCMMISLLRNVPQVSERCREGRTKDGLVGCELRGKTVGIVGAGAIGTRTAELCHAFGCTILGLFIFLGAKLFRIRGRYNRNTIETEKNTPETTKMISEVSAIVYLSIYRIVLSGQRLLEIAASVKVHPQIYARCHRLFFFSD